MRAFVLLVLCGWVGIAAAQGTGGRIGGGDWGGGGGGTGGAGGGTSSSWSSGGGWNHDFTPSIPSPPKIPDMPRYRPTSGTTSGSGIQMTPEEIDQLNREMRERRGGDGTFKIFFVL